MNERLDEAAPSPLHDGFHMPAEWEPHRRTWMCWPARRECFGAADAMRRRALGPVAGPVHLNLCFREPLVPTGAPLVAARVLQGLGGGGLRSIAQVVIADAARAIERWSESVLGAIAKCTGSLTTVSLALLQRSTSALASSTVL